MSRESVWRETGRAPARSDGGKLAQARSGVGHIGLLTLLGVSGDPDDSAGDTGSGRSGRLRAQVISPAMYDDGATDDAALTFEGQMRIDAVVGRFAVAEISDVPRRRKWPGMVGSMGVEVPSSRRPVGCTAVAVLVDVKSVLSPGQSGEVGLHPNAPRRLDEGHRALQVVALGGGQHRDRACLRHLGSGSRANED